MALYNSLSKKRMAPYSHRGVRYMVLYKTTDRIVHSKVRFLA